VQEKVMEVPQPGSRTRIQSMVIPSVQEIRIGSSTIRILDQGSNNE
jgi:hypothetical protein